MIEQTTASFEPKNKEQELAIEKGIEFINKGNADEFFVVVGKAGTGKTTIAQAIISGFVKKKKVLVCALSHKAKLVISDKIFKAHGNGSVISKSVAGSLGMNMDIETGKFLVDGNTLTPAIKKANIILVDEASMINEESHELIMTEKSKKAKVIYLGDIRQLPPIRENNDINRDKPSPVFYSNNIAVLTERIRQGEQSPILPFADCFGDNSRKKFPVINPVPVSMRKNVVNEKGALVFADDIECLVEVVLPLYKHAVDNADVNVIKTVAYRNERRKFINYFIRSHLFGEENSDKQFVQNELIIFNDNYFINDVDEPISNSYETQVLNVRKAHDGIYNVWYLQIIYESKPTEIIVLDESEVKRNAADVSRAFEYAKKLPFGSSERSDALSKAWHLKQAYAPIEYAYAITSHKAQGSTYNTVIVDEVDIMSVRPISNKEKSQSMYTAITRASTTCIVIDGQGADDTLQQAVDLSFKNLTEKS